jgi:hypothetical protein
VREQDTAPNPTHGHVSETPRARGDPCPKLQEFKALSKARRRQHETCSPIRDSLHRTAAEITARIELHFLQAQTADPSHSRPPHSLQQSATPWQFVRGRSSRVSECGCVQSDDELSCCVSRTNIAGRNLIPTPNPEPRIPNPEPLNPNPQPPTPNPEPRPPTPNPDPKSTQSPNLRADT